MIVTGVCFLTQKRFDDIMKSVLYQSPYIEVRKSPVHGYGVFAKQNLPANIILEETPFISIPQGIASDYVFAFPRGGTPPEESEGVKMEFALPFGYACIYNHSDTPNASWLTKVKERLFVFFTLTDIKKDEEIRTFYGPDSYWVEHPHINKI